MAQLFVADVRVALDGGVLDGAVRPLDSAVRPRAAQFGQAMVGLGLLAGPVECMPAVDAWLVALGPVGSGCGCGLLVHRPVVGKSDTVVHQKDDSTGLGRRTKPCGAQRAALGGHGRPPGL